MLLKQSRRVQSRLSPDQLFYWPITSQCCNLHRGSFVRKGDFAHEPHTLSMADQSLVSVVQYTVECWAARHLNPKMASNKIAQGLFSSDRHDCHLLPVQPWEAEFENLLVTSNTKAHSIPSARGDEPRTSQSTSEIGPLHNIPTAPYHRSRAKINGRGILVWHR